ncbi:MAG: hypothetical protein Q7S86_04165 [bacterium]|nr:hypothetical protein [bacterium]
MKNNIAYIGAALALLLAGCDATIYEPPVYTFFPTNHWRVKSVVQGAVVVEAVGTNLIERLRVVKATPVSPLTNDQPARVEMVVRRRGSGLEFVSAKAYPAEE